MCLIIEYPSGVWYSNQTGGHNCLQPSLEGVLVPVRNEGSEDGRLVFSPESDLSDYFKGPKWCGSGATSGIDADDADYIEKALSEAGLSESISVDRSRLNESHEAWIRVQVMGDDSSEAFSGFAPYRQGVLTWGNSD